ncbi:hypothetical protein EDB86DRAFT_2806885 [Lactarius hatsudake]|nr:hypothetical protein EDB86DRAFT_2806885 [Lactarius hatsudake]
MDRSNAGRDKRKGKERSLGPIRTPVTQSHRVNKLEPPRPFPTVPAGVSATGPRSAHHEGKNYIAITRKTNLGAYLRRCKDVVLKDGYKSLHLSALGAAIPHLCTLAASLPEILPFPAEEIRTEVLTGTVDVQDELVPDDEDEDISYRTRAKSSLSVVVIIGDGVDEPTVGGSKWASRGKRRKRAAVVWSRAEDAAASEPESQGDEQSDSVEC